MILDCVYSGINILIPSICPVCGRHPAVHPHPVCRSCAGALQSPASGIRTTAVNLRAVWSCCWYHGKSAECVRLLKYGGKRKMMNVFNEMIGSFLAGKPDLDAAELIIPVPVHWSRLHGRGYNQALLIARSVSETASIPISRNGLIKIRNTPPQAGITKKRRIRNLKDSFLAPDRLSLVGKSVLLVDDVITTGATMETCAAELLKAGVREVLGFTIAKTPLSQRTENRKQRTEDRKWKKRI